MKKIYYSCVDMASGGGCLTCLVDSGLKITASSSLQDREQLLCKVAKVFLLGKDIEDDRVLLLAAYRTWGERCIQHIHGNFSFVIEDQYKKRLFCARDRMGIVPFFYYWCNQRFIFATDMAEIVASSDIQLSPAPSWIVDHLGSIWFDNKATFYQEIARLPPAHTLTLSIGRLQIRRYWDFDLSAEIHFGSDKEYAEAATLALQAAVEANLSPDLSTGIELSGGLDSSAIAAVAAARQQQNTGEFTSFSHASPKIMIEGDGYSPDERSEIDLARKFIGIKSSYFFTNEQAGVLPMLSKAVSLCGGVARCDFSTLTSGLHALAAEQGVKIMLSGLGGDQLVTSCLPTRRYLLRDRAWRLLWSEMNTHSQQRSSMILLSLARLCWSEYSPWCRPNPKKLAKEQRRITKMAYIQTLLTQTPALQAYIAEVDWRERLQHWWAVQDQRPPTFREAQYRNITRPVLTNRLEATAQISADLGIEYRYPLLEVALMRFFLALPVDQTRRNGIGRYLFRCCTEGLLPNEIRWAEKARGTLYPWYFHSIRQDLQQDIPAVADHAPEEVKVNWLIAQAKRDWFRQHNTVL